MEEAEAEEIAVDPAGQGDKKMKAAVVLLTAILLSGCYTVIWTPDEEFPNESNTEYDNDSYYPDTYYGGYYDFYDYPWWLTFTPPSYIAPKNTPDRSDNNTGTIRNTDNGRGKEDRNEILATPPPTRIQSTESSDDNSSNSGSSRTSVESSNTNSNNNTSSRGSSNSNSNNVRNSDGGRNSGGRR
jgi:hypothetical protein